MCIWQKAVENTQATRGEVYVCVCVWMCIWQATRGEVYTLCTHHVHTMHTTQATRGEVRKRAREEGGGKGGKGKGKGGGGGGFPEGWQGHRSYEVALA